MKGFLRAGLLAICFTLILVQGVSAFNVSQLTVDPSGSLTPGTQVVIEGTIDFFPSSKETFDSTHELHFSTDLEKAKWNCTLVLNGTENLQSRSQGYSLSLTGWTVSKPRSVHESVKFSLEGIAPSVEWTQNKSLI
jgi:hypothetical protein